jgi:Tfp pilus assembly PilM family ATPase
LAQVRLVDRAARDFRLIAAATAKTPGFEENITSGPSARQADRRRRFAEVQEILSHNHFTGRKCILALPARDCFVQPLSVPRECIENPQEIKTAIEWELRDKGEMFFGHPIDIDATVVQYIMTGNEIYEDGLSKEEVITFGVSRDITSQYLKMARDAKIKIIGLNVESCAVLECFSRLLRRSADMDKSYMFIDLGVTSTQVVISRGPNMVFARNLLSTFPVSAEDDHEDQEPDGPPVEVSVDADQPSTVVFESEADQQVDCLAGLVAEINQCLDYCESVGGSREIDRVVFTGGGAYNKGACNELSVRLGLSGQVGNPLLGIKDVNLASLPKEITETTVNQTKPGMLRCPDWAVAVGLSVGASVETAA